MYNQRRVILLDIGLFENAKTVPICRNIMLSTYFLSKS